MKLTVLFATRHLEEHMMQSYTLSAGYQIPSLYEIRGMASMERGGCPRLQIGNQLDILISGRTRHHMTIGAGLNHGMRVQHMILRIRGMKKGRKRTKDGVTIVGMRASPANRGHSRGQNMKRHGSRQKNNELKQRRRRKKKPTQRGEGGGRKGVPREQRIGSAGKSLGFLKSKRSCQERSLLWMKKLPG